MRPVAVWRCLRLPAATQVQVARRPRHEPHGPQVSSVLSVVRHVRPIAERLLIAESARAPIVRLPRLQAGLVRLIPRNRKAGLDVICVRVTHEEALCEQAPRVATRH
ncbi:hypothetical protein TRVL_10032 [Trypanosoma vivax]|nr:hypothetical protein TRVL_10032 [Trypanosoma vivax]